MHFEMSSAISFDMDQSRILLSGNGLDKISLAIKMNANEDTDWEYMFLP